MKKISQTALFLILSLVFASPLWAFEATFEENVTISGKTFGPFQVKVKDKKFRMETNLGGTTAVSLRNSEGVFNFLPALAYQCL